MRYLFALVFAVAVFVAPSALDRVANGAPPPPSPNVNCGVPCLGGGLSPPNFPCTSSNYQQLVVIAPHEWECEVVGGVAPFYVFAWVKIF